MICLLFLSVKEPGLALPVIPYCCQCGMKYRLVLASSSWANATEEAELDVC